MDLLKDKRRSKEAAVTGQSAPHRGASPRVLETVPDRTKPPRNDMHKNLAAWSPLEQGYAISVLKGRFEGDPRVNDA